MPAEAQRLPGSEWIKNHPRFLEIGFDISKVVLRAFYPLLKSLAPRASANLLLWSEKLVKGYLFNCQMCGQCILHSTGMTCPMTCPKNLRNGPCGGVRADGHCEVIPEMPCVWVQAWERSQFMSHYKDDVRILQPPVNYQLKDTSSWINFLEGIDQRPQVGWIPLSELEESQSSRSSQ